MNCSSPKPRRTRPACGPTPSARVLSVAPPGRRHPARGPVVGAPGGAALIPARPGRQIHQGTRLGQANHLACYVQQRAATERRVQRVCGHLQPPLLRQTKVLGQGALRRAGVWRTSARKYARSAVDQSLTRLLAWASDSASYSRPTWRAGRQRQGGV